MEREEEAVRKERKEERKNNSKGQRNIQISIT